MPDTSVTAAAPSRPECPPEQLAERRYFATIHPLLDDALEHAQLETLVDVLTRILARIGLNCGIPAVADIARRFGGYVGEFARQDAAEREAEEARKSGRRPH